jgi:hypothetical protein
VTVENNCAYKFALPAVAGSLAYPSGKMALNQMISGAAFASLKTFASTVTTLLPFTAYLAYITLTISYDVDHQCHCS